MQRFTVRQAVSAAYRGTWHCHQSQGASQGASALCQQPRPAKPNAAAPRLQAVRRATRFAPPAACAGAVPVLTSSRLAGRLLPPLTRLPRARPQRSQQTPHPAGQAQRVVCLRIVGVEIPGRKCVEFSIQYIYGIGPTTAKRIMQGTGIDPTKRTNQLTEEEVASLAAAIQQVPHEGELRTFVAMNIKRLKEISCYRGRRHAAGLPVRGQRTRTNARTRKGKPRMPVSKKKKAGRKK